MAKVKISIRYKFLILISFLLVGSVFAYLGLANHVFTKDKTQLVYDYNRSFVTNISSELSKLLESATSKMKLSALLMSQKTNEKLLDNLFDSETSFSSLFVSRDYQSFKKNIFWDQNFFSAYGYTQKEFTENVLAKEDIPWEKIKEKGSYLWSLNSTMALPVLAYAKVVVTDSGKQSKQYVLMGLLRLDHLAKSIQANKLSNLYILNGDLEMVFSGKGETLGGRFENVSKKIGSEGVQSSVFEYQIGDESYLAAFAKTRKNDLVVFSRVSKAKALSVVERFIYRSILFASIVLTLAFIVAILFSRTLTKPLELLLDAMKKVAKGNLSVSIKLHTKDEIHVLAENFNHMISDLRNSREELEETNKGLENKVKERTRELEAQNIAVKDAQEALLKTSRLAAAGEIAGRAAHEVLNPLTSIITRLQKMETRIQAKESHELNMFKDITKAWHDDLSKGKDSLLEEWNKPSSIDVNKSLLEEDIENISYINKEVVGEFNVINTDLQFLLNEGRRINKIVQSMRSLNRTSEDKRNYDSHAIITESFKIMADTMDQLGIQFNIDQSFSGHHVFVDKDEFIQAMTNLIRNSIYALKESKKADKFINAEASISDGRLNIHIIDNGMGIKDMEKEKLFEVNFSTKDSSEGTGLGLSISRRFIRSFDGDLELYSSNIGEGSNFKISLPLKEVKGRATG